MLTLSSLYAAETFAEEVLCSDRPAEDMDRTYAVLEAAF